MRHLVWAAVTLAVIAGGCEYQRQQQMQRRQSNVWLVESVNDTAIRNAVVRQRTIYPYHFMPQSEQLNELGVQELEILGEHYRRTPGVLSIAPAVAQEEALQGARVRQVMMMLEQQGVDLARMTIDDRTPGGEGISGARAVDILKREREQGPQMEQETSTLTVLKGEADYADTNAN